MTVIQVESISFDPPKQDREDLYTREQEGGWGNTDLREGGRDEDG